MTFGLLGYPLDHSYSPQIHSKLGDYTYELLPVESQLLDHFFQSADFTGINVTSPYKITVMRYCHELTPSAKSIGCVNTIVRHRNGKLIGHNTDYFGFSYMLNACDRDFTDKKVLILGSGGAAHTAYTVLCEAGAKPVIISRSGENNYRNLFLHRDAFAIVNATPVGMYPNTMVSPVDLNEFPFVEIVLDLIYNPSKTKLLMDAEERNIVSMNGLSMLVAQAKESAEWFTQTTIPDDVIPKIQAQLEKQMKNIVLVGMPGCGKSTIGRQLAQKLGRIFVDLDDVLEKENGLSVDEIITTQGEEAFRVLEANAICEYGKKSALVISTGGGCVTKDANYYPLHQNGVIYWIKRDINLLSTAGRPLSMATSLSEMYTVREPLYARFADHTIENTADPEQVAQKIWGDMNEDSCNQRA